MSTIILYESDVCTESWWVCQVYQFLPFVIICCHDNALDSRPSTHSGLLTLRFGLSRSRPNSLRGASPHRWVLEGQKVGSICYTKLAYLLTLFCWQELHYQRLRLATRFWQSFWHQKAHGHSTGLCTERICMHPKTNRDAQGLFYNNG